MHSLSVNQTAAVAPLPYQAPVQPANTQAPKKNTIIDEMLAELTDVITTGVQNQDSSSAKALLGYLDGEAGHAQALPPRLVDMLDEVLLGTAASAGKAEEFKALLGEYVAIQWALSTLNEVIRKQQAAQIDDAALAEKLQAKAFLRQMEAAIVGRLDSQDWQSNWRAFFEESLAPLADNVEIDALAHQLVQSDAIGTVETLLQAAPRPDLSALVA